MYNLIEYSNNYSKLSGSLWQYYRGHPKDILTNFESFKFKMEIIGKIFALVIQRVLKYLPR